MAAKLLDLSARKLNAPIKAVTTRKLYYSGFVQMNQQTIDDYNAHIQDLSRKRKRVF